MPPPGGDPVADADLAGRVAAELAAALGGPFAEVAGHVAVAAGLAAPQQLAAYGIPADPTRFGFVGVTFEPEEPGWRAQVLAVAGGPYLVSLVHPLAEADAVGPGGHPVRRPLGDPQPLVQRLLPGLRLPDDRSADHDAALYDAVLAGPQGRVRCGVRRLTGPDGVQPPMPCAYVLRADIPAP